MREIIFVLLVPLDKYNFDYEISRKTEEITRKTEASGMMVGIFLLGLHGKGDVIA